MSEFSETPVTSQRGSVESTAAVQRGVLAPVASMASGYASILGLVLLFSVNRIGRLTRPPADATDA